MADWNNAQNDEDFAPRHGRHSAMSLPSINGDTGAIDYSTSQIKAKAGHATPTSRTSRVSVADLQPAATQQSAQQATRVQQPVQGGYAYGSESAAADTESVLPTKLRKTGKVGGFFKGLLKVILYIILFCVALGIGAAIGAFYLLDANPLALLGF